MILDTNALSAVADGDPEIESILAHATEIYIPVIVLGEYRYGILNSRSRKGYEDWLEAFVRSCRILRIDEHTAREYASIRSELKAAGRPLPANDVWIAALARQHALPLLTRDAHFNFVARLEQLTW